MDSGKSHTSGPRKRRASDGIPAGADLVRLNRRVDIDGVKPPQAAAEWLRSRGLI